MAGGPPSKVETWREKRGTGTGTEKPADSFLRRNGPAQNRRGSLGNVMCYHPHNDAADLGEHRQDPEEVGKGEQILFFLRVTSGISRRIILIPGTRQMRRTNIRRSRGKFYTRIPCRVATVRVIRRYSNMVCFHSGQGKVADSSTAVQRTTTEHSGGIG